MKSKYRIIPWICFAITLILFTFVWVNAPASIMVEVPNITLSFVLITATVFVNALILGVLCTGIKWIYPIATIIFAWVFSDFVYLHVHHNDTYLFGRRFLYNDFHFIPMVVLVANFLGLIIGLFIRLRVRRIVMRM